MIVPMRHYEFTISEPYREGALLSATDAAILNRMRAASIREAFLRRIPKREILSPQDLHILRTRVSEYDEHFALPAPPAIRPVWTLDEELRLLAAENYTAPDIEEVARRRYSARFGGTPGPVSDYIWEPK